jgi:DNA-binding response OmpR family regulator
MAKVLLVESVPSRRALYRFDLERDGHEIVAAATAMEAARLLEEARPQIVVLDPEALGKEGVEVLMRVNERTAVRVIVISTLGGNGGERSRSTADAFIMRASALRELRETVRTVLEKRGYGAIVRFKRRA